jgi:hypothetical protein
MSELIPCPGGCGNQVHRRAVECTFCGYRPEITNYQEQLGSLSTICSILTGFSLASLVAMVTAEAKVIHSIFGAVAAGLWLFSSLVLLGVLVMAELLRRQEWTDTVIAVSIAERDRFAHRCEWLLTAFTIALGFVALGVVLLGFQLSLWHGIVGIIGATAAGLIIAQTLR